VCERQAGEEEEEEEEEDDETGVPQQEEEMYGAYWLQEGLPGSFAAGGS
jgi:hypothetical protein